ncbi:hypothetical protein GYMLUDRAFT_166901 [Collybiopsis luxurians FD-317 M1]|uniref:Unplaced genomic scaffold GYMLUscaffold_24, whole genome shotgun sequence n=1 Tax=Collybiopsis luxurians FD-317 M1 TaxID=944289 RepID=A0A0D0BBX2_9AGAR|nr:hypothetical protein GYMLUDRAFT_166901 [Collybiopsis luxurians FD-317 M1]
METPQNVEDLLETPLNQSLDEVLEVTFNVNTTSATSNIESDEAFQMYAESVQSESVGFVRLHGRLFAVEGWIRDMGQGNHQWYHFEVTGSEDNPKLVCRCSAGTWHCIHKCYYLAYGACDFSERASAEVGPCPKIILFLKENGALDEGRSVLLFSVAQSEGLVALSHRVFVRYEGTDDGAGKWQCSRREGTSCVHIEVACEYMQRKLLGNNDRTGELSYSQGKDICESILLRAISYLPVIPPRWCMLPEEKKIYGQPKPLRTAPERLGLSSYASCACVDGGRSFYNPDKPTLTRACTVYTLTQAFQVEIELQPCPRCPVERHRYIGPEPRGLGLFNFNNSALFAHELLNEYISAFSGSETPFMPWVNQVARRYEESESVIPFANEGLFRASWFTYARLIEFENDKSCPFCGVFPENVIWGGVSISFGRKFVNAELEPPTMVSSQAPERPSRSSSKQEWLPDGKMRRRLREWIHDGGLKIEKGIRQEDQEQILEATIERARMLETELYPWLESQSSHLKKLFRRRMGHGALDNCQWKPAQAYSALFKLTSDKSTMQTMTRSVLRKLETFLKEPTPNNHAGLLGVPTLYTILHIEYTNEGNYAPETLGVAQWMLVRAAAVLEMLLNNNQEPLLLKPPETFRRSDSSPEIRDWERTGCFYHLPQIRFRPRYPKLPHDRHSDVNKERIGTCRKYYESYSQKCLTGGIMACWCSHSICYGFHCIPVGEGRNDVFSAIITRWPTAPKRIVYDFACALGPYCWTREPQFFADTQFVIDSFHVPGHTKCSTAAFLKTYTAVDPDLIAINSSAAECGNSGLTRIRKSVSYMGQVRATIYTWVFISVWNRLQILNLRKRLEKTA